MLAPERDQVLDRRLVTPFDITPQKLPTLRKPQRIHTRCTRQYRMRSQILAYTLNLLRQVSQKRRSLVAIWIFVQADVVYEGAWVRFDGEVAHCVEAVGGVVVAEAVPDEERERF